MEMNAVLDSKKVTLEPKKRSAEVLEFEEQLRRRFIGQEEAVEQLVDVYQTVLAKMAVPGRPISNLLFLGPTGSGKTRLVEAAAEILFGSPAAIVKIDCAEFQHQHEIAKLIGSPPGYIGHRETAPVITQEALDRTHTEKLKLSFLLFDEIEKASDSLWQLLLGILDKATLTLGDNRKVDLSRTLVFMTSNLGASEISRLVSGGIGFVSKPETAEDSPEIERKIHRVAVEAAKRRFSPEFMNRIDKVVVFRTLSRDQLRGILDLELLDVQRRIIMSQADHPFEFHCTLAARDFLLREGADLTYGARHLKRAVERYLVHPLSSLISSGQVQAEDSLEVDVDNEGKALVFRKEDRKRSRRSGGSGSTPQPTPLVQTAEQRYMPIGLWFRTSGK
jgi:ATP-dependent Clp protease ATP-binding subunit ClpA